MKTQMATLMFCLTALAGVAPAQAPQPTTAASTGDTPANTVTVQNDRKVPVTVYIEYGEFDRRLGVVQPLQIATLPLPAWAVQGHDRIRLFVHPEGAGADLASREFSLEPPARLGVLIPPQGGMRGTRPTPKDTMMEVIPPEELADATLTVDNPRDKSVTVFADMDPFDVRLGVVPAHGRVTLRFPKSVVGPDDTIEIVVHPEGGFDLASQTMQVRKGEHLGLRVPVR